MGDSKKPELEQSDNTQPAPELSPNLSDTTELPIKQQDNALIPSKQAQNTRLKTQAEESNGCTGMKRPDPTPTEIIPMPAGARANGLSRNGKKIGRPTKYRPKYNRMIIEYFDGDHIQTIETSHRNKKGEEWTTNEEKANKLPTIAGFCAFMRVSKQTLHDWKERFPAFLDAYTHARCLYEDRVTDLAARGFLNPAFSIFLAKNTLDWSDKAEVKHSGGMQHDHFFEGMLKRAEAVEHEEQAMITTPVKRLPVDGKASNGEGEA